MMNRQIIFIASIYLLSIVARNALAFGMKNSADCTTNNGTTSRIHEIFMGRCHYFQMKLKSKSDSCASENYNCTRIWSAFRAAIVGKAPCDIRVSDFDDFLSLIKHNPPPNRSLFWSGTYDIAHECLYKKFL